MQDRPQTGFPARFNLAHHLLDARVEEGAGGRVALVTPERAITFAEVQAEANRAGNAFAAAGVGPEERVLLALPDVPELVHGFFGALKLGAVPIIINPELSEDELRYVLGYTRARAVVAAPGAAARLAPLLAGAPLLRVAFVVGAPGLGFSSWQERVAVERSELRNLETGPDDVALWLFTSGSTGRPLAAVHLQHDYAFAVEAYARGVLGMDRDDVVLSVPRLFFNYATGMSLIFPFALGAAAVLFPDRPTPERIAELVATHRATVLATVPTMVARMLATPAVTRAALGSLRVAVSAGEALPAELHRRWNDALGVELLDGIGSVELCHIFISNRRGDVLPGSIGHPVPGYEARVVRSDGTDANDFEPGVLWVRGDSAATHYHGAHERSKATLRGDWVVTGDLVHRDPDGRFFYAGRSDDMLKVSGIYVSPLEIENALLMHPAVRECAVLGHVDENGLTRPRACVVLQPGSDAGAQELERFVRERLPAHKVPRVWEFLPELPRSDRGKLLRRKLR